MCRAMCLILATLLISVVSAQNAGKISLNEAETTKAWEALKKQDYKGAIKHADVVIEEFQDDAEAMQAELIRTKALPPPIGEVSDATVKKTLFSRGVLNDFAACLFIKGEALGQINDRAGAKRAYEAACKLTYARIWDPEGWFWSPSTKSCSRAKRIK